jgi:hypothetical protein
VWADRSWIIFVAASLQQNQPVLIVINGILLCDICITDFSKEKNAFAK